MEEVFAYGFGTVLADLEMRPDGAARLFDMFSDKRAKKFFRDWKKNSPEMEWDHYLTVVMLAEGPENMIASVINENEFGGKKVIVGNKGAIYAPVTLPKNDGAKKTQITEKEVKDAIAGYLGLCYKGVKRGEIDYYFFTE